MNRTGIDYLDYSWNPLAMRCTRVSPACDHCWHLRMAKRKAGNPQLSDLERQASAGLIPPVLMPDRLDEPLRMKKPQRIGVQFMGDLGHEAVDMFDRHQIFNVMNKCAHQTFLVLTKRPETFLSFGDLFWTPNIWLGVTVENQEQADQRLPILLQIPAAIRFVSYEPALGAVDWSLWLPPFEDCDYYAGGCTRPENVFAETGNPSSRPGLQSCRPGYCVFGRRGLDLLIAGGETGPHARPSHPNWFRSARDQAVTAGVPFFFKSWGEWTPFLSWEDACHQKRWGFRKDLRVLWPNGIAGSAVLGNKAETWDQGCRGFMKLGKNFFSRLLDGCEWNQLPEVAI